MTRKKLIFFNFNEEYKEILKFYFSLQSFSHFIISHVSQSIREEKRKINRKKDYFRKKNRPFRLLPRFCLNSTCLFKGEEYSPPLREIHRRPFSDPPGKKNSLVLIFAIPLPH